MFSRCAICGKTVYALLECSEPLDTEEEGYGQKRLCLFCKQSTKEILSTQYEENWRDLNQQSNYLDNELLLHSTLTKIPILRNGNDFKLKATNFGKKKITVHQTCGFDSIVQL